jgi:type IV pilus assembly protein PilY1
MAGKAITKFAVLAFSALATAWGANVDLATVPLTSGVTKTVRPNIYFILDDSGSMDYDYMPESIEKDKEDNKACFRNHGRNTIYYNPDVTYAAPKNADGTDFADSNTTYTRAKTDGFDRNSSTTNLSETRSQTIYVDTQIDLGNNPFSTSRNSRDVTVTSNRHGLPNGTSITISGATSFNGINPNGSYTISNANTNTFQIRVGNNANASSSGGGPNAVISYKRATTVAVPIYGWYEYRANPTSPPSTCAADSSYDWRWPETDAEKRNFTNWYSYYRTRMLMMKSATGRAFADIGDEFRVGYSTIGETGTSGTNFLKIARFDSSHRADWYSRLYGAGCTKPGGCGTPLRGALSKAGRLYAGKLLTGNDDPVQYSCQQNFTILTTDGYWNTRGGESNEYTATKEDGRTKVGDQDGGRDVPRPYYEAGKYENTLADIAMYYYKTDLRPDTLADKLGGLTDDGARIPVTKNNVPTGSQDGANWQHMNTFTLGLGVSGKLGYDENYLTGGSADYNAILQGNKNWPNPNTSSDDNTVVERIDDLWHAAVNGRGRYLSAENPDTLVSALRKTLASISVTEGSAAAAATSTLEPVAGDNFAYVAQYTTGFWHGNLQAREINVTTGELSPTVIWAAQTKLASKVQANSDTRTIYTFSSEAANKLKPFDSANLTAEKSAGYFSASSSNPSGALTQYTLWSAEQRSAATPDAMIAFLRGQRQHEDRATNETRLFRERQQVLGDIVNAAPVFVRRPPFNYSDAGYHDFVADQTDPSSPRAGMVYVGANDGMLHAFDADTGVERWAYVPSAVIPRLYRLADASYASNHEYHVDGPITVGDAYDATAKEWRTVLVGGLGRGGKAYYALDVTNPSSPKALWEFSTAQDADLGYTYGNPILTKRASDGRWVVLFASGYNNTGGDSKGRLYVVDAFTGAKLDEIVTSELVTDPNLSGIAKITNWVLNTLVDNTTQYVYGGDLSGALWRFDLNTGTSQRLGRTSATAGNLPITVRPEVGRVKDGAGTYHRVVYFGTGRYLGLGDLAGTAPSSTIKQGIFAVKDKGTDLGVLTDDDAALVEQALDVSGDAEGLARKIANPVAVNWQEDNGWYLKTPVGERMNVDLRLQLGTLVVIANEPNDDYCVVGGKSWLYALDYRTGTAVTGREVAWTIGASIATAVSIVILPTHDMFALVTRADGTVEPKKVQRRSGSAVGVRRVSWREIF